MEARQILLTIARSPRVHSLATECVAAQARILVRRTISSPEAREIASRYALSDVPDVLLKAVEDNAGKLSPHLGFSVGVGAAILQRDPPSGEEAVRTRPPGLISQLIDWLAQIGTSRRRASAIRKIRTEARARYTSEQEAAKESSQHRLSFDRAVSDATLRMQDISFCIEVLEETAAALRALSLPKSVESKAMRRLENVVAGHLDLIADELEA